MLRDDSMRVLVFRVGDERFGIPLSDVHEVLDAQPIQRVPDASTAVLGVTSIRGALTTVYDVRALLSVGGDADGALLVFDRGDRCIAVAIDDVFDATVVEPSELLAVPRRAASDGLLTGMLRRGSDLVAVLDTNALLSAATSDAQGERT
jgi:purine-binding chemotaxis protein CheW